MVDEEKLVGQLRQLRLRLQEQNQCGYTGMRISRMDINAVFVVCAEEEYQAEPAADCASFGNDDGTFPMSSACSVWPATTGIVAAQDTLMARLVADGFEATLVPGLMDCIMVNDFFTNAPGRLAPTVAQIRAETPFMPEIKSRGRPQPRRKCVFIVPDRRGVAFYGGYVGSTAGHVHAQRLDSSKPVVHGLLQRLLAYESGLNHCIVTSYETEKKRISAHSDKTTDLVPGSFIYLLSAGPTRQLRFNCKTTKKPVCTLDLVHGSLFIMGAKANAAMTHELLESPVACSERDSLIYRACATFLNSRQMARKRSELEKQEMRALQKAIDKAKAAAEEKDVEDEGSGDDSDGDEDEVEAEDHDDDDWKAQSEVEAASANAKKRGRDSDAVLAVSDASPKKKKH